MVFCFENIPNNLLGRNISFNNDGCVLLQTFYTHKFVPVLVNSTTKTRLFFSQPTIPEEGPEIAEEEQNTSSIMSSLPPLEISSGSIVAPQQPTYTGTSMLKPKPESRAIKNLAQELVTEKGAVRKETTSTIKKSNSLRSESKSQSSSPIPTESSNNIQTKNSSSSGQEGNLHVTKSPKISRHESMERTVQRITKAIRGTSRSESRSKKNRETSVSPSKCGASKADVPSSSTTNVTATTAGTTASGSKGNKKETGKKNAHEKREIFKSLH